MDYKDLKKDDLLAKCIELDAALVESNEKIAKLEAEKAESKNKPKIEAVTRSGKSVARINALTAKKRVAREKLNKKK
jgi:hypothetical protein